MELDRLVNAFDGERADRLERGVLDAADRARRGVRRRGRASPGSASCPTRAAAGVLRQMMDWLLADAAKRGEPLAILWASEAAIYQRFGFGMATQVSSFEVDRERVVFREPLPPRDGVRIRMVDAEEALRIATGIYEQLRATVPGSIFRPRGHVAEPGHGRRRVDARQERAEVPDRPRGRRRAARLGDLPGQRRLHRARARRAPSSSWSSRRSMPRPSQRLWQWLVSLDLVTTIRAMRLPYPLPHAAAAHRAAPARAGRRATGCGCASWTSPRRSRRGRTRDRGASSWSWRTPSCPPTPAAGSSPSPRMASRR